MRIPSLVAAPLLLIPMLAARPLHAQRVSADIVIASDPVYGRVAMRDGYSTYRTAPPARRVVARRIFLVEGVRFHSHRQWLRHGFRPVTIYLIDGRYYDRTLDHGRRHARLVTVYERDGRYYLPRYSEGRHGDRHYHDGYDR